MKAAAVRVSDWVGGVGKVERAQGWMGVMGRKWWRVWRMRRIGAEGVGGERMVWRPRRVQGMERVRVWGMAGDVVD